MNHGIEYKLSILFYGVDSPVNNYEYILNDIFSNYKHIDCDYILVGEENRLNKIYDVVVYNCADPTRYSHFGFPPTYEQVKNLVLNCKPKIIIQLADECFHEHNEIHNLLANLCNLFLKQHRHETQIYSYSDNLFPIPLGYVNQFYDRKKTLKPISERKYTWSWVGVLKNDRREMINSFWSMWKNIVVCNAYMPTSEVFDLYSESIFVPCGRGNFSLDCFRNYEATISGAIPVVVGPEEEINWTFNFFEEKPPWIYAQSWEEATQKCQQVQFQFDILQSIQEQNILWWKRILNNIQVKVKEALLKEVIISSTIIEELKNKENNIIKPISVIYYQ